jgi:hypothetical protein
MSDTSKDDRPILQAWAVKDGDRLIFISLEKGAAEAMAQPSSMNPGRRLVRGWFRLAKEAGQE